MPKIPFPSRRLFQLVTLQSHTGANTCMCNKVTKPQCDVRPYLEGNHEKITALVRVKQVCVRAPGSSFPIQRHGRIQWEKGELPASCFIGGTMLRRINLLRRMNLFASKNKIKSNTCTNIGKQTGTVYQEFQSLEISPNVFSSPFHCSKHVMRQKKPLFDQEKLSILHSHGDQQRFGLSNKEGLCHGLVSASTCISYKHPR